MVGPDWEGRKMSAQAHVEMLAQDWGSRRNGIARPTVWQGIAHAWRNAEGVVRHSSVPGRNVGASLAVAAAVLVVVANVAEWNWPLIAGDRASIATLALLGLAQYLCCPASAEPRGVVTNALELVGVGAIALVAVGLAIESHVVLTLLLSLLVLVWAVSTLRHQLDHGLRGERHRSQPHAR